MHYFGQPRWLMLAAIVLLSPATAAWSQFSGAAAFELSDSVAVDAADSSVLAHLERVKALSADRQWDEVLDTLRQVMESSGERMFELSPRRYIPARDYCHLRILALPPEAQAIYRERVDPQAKRQYEQGVSQRRPELLRQVIAQTFASSWGDESLLALGEMALEQGEPAQARHYWRMLIEQPPKYLAKEQYEPARNASGLLPEEVRLLDRWYELDYAYSDPPYTLRSDPPLPDDARLALVDFWRRQGLPAARLAYPRTNLSPAQIRARLVLASILESKDDPAGYQRASDELQEFAQLYPTAQGSLAGKKAPYVQTLTTLLESSGQWPQKAGDLGWPTFAGAQSRNRALAPTKLDIGRLRWRRGVAKLPAVDTAAPTSFGYPLQRVAEENGALLSYHPVLADGMVLYNNQDQIFAFDIETGEPAWPAPNDRPPGQIYVKESAFERQHARYNTLGVPRFTMTVFQDRLLARLGSPITTTTPDSAPFGASGYLVGLDLNAEGRRVWEPILPEDGKWAFEGAPVSDGANLYVAMRRSDVRPQAHVACFDAETGKMRWRKFICAAETPAHGQVEECTHNLLTLHGDMLYYNTNLGAVAAISTAGQVRWLWLYRRAERGNLNKPAEHFYRDLTPCIYDRGRLYAAPSDSDQIFALDAHTGGLLWETLPSHPADAVHLLGVGSGNLIATGNKVWTINATDGRLLSEWPEGATPRGYGRGVLVGDQVLWPTRDKIFVLSSQNGTQLRQPIELSIHNATGGNLIAGDGSLLIAGGEELLAFDLYLETPKAVESVAPTAQLSPARSLPLPEPAPGGQ